MTWHFTNMSDVEWYWYSHPTHFYDIGRKKKTGIGGECSGAKLGARGRLGGLFVVDSGFPIWRFPKIEVPPKSSISRWIFHHKPSMLGSPHWEIPSNRCRNCSCLGKCTNMSEEIVVEYVDTCFMLVCCDGPVWGFYLAVISPISRSFSCVWLANCWAFGPD